MGGLRRDQRRAHGRGRRTRAVRRGAATGARRVRHCRGLDGHRAHVAGRGGRRRNAAGWPHGPEERLARPGWLTAGSGRTCGTSSPPCSPRVCLRALAALMRPMPGVAMTATSPCQQAPVPAAVAAARCGASASRVDLVHSHGLPGGCHWRSRCVGGRSSLPGTTPSWIRPGPRRRRESIRGEGVPQRRSRRAKTSPGPRPSRREMDENDPCRRSGPRKNRGHIGPREARASLEPLWS